LLLEYVFNTYGVPKYLYDNGFFTHNKSFSNDICNKLKIKRIDKLKTGNIKKKIFEYRKPSIKYRKLLIPVTTLYLKKEAKTIKENIIQFKNNRYLIMSNTNIKKRQKIIIHYTWDYTNIIVEYNNKFYNTQILAKVTSVKGKSKYY
jgi:hypothetical protein